MHIMNNYHVQLDNNEGCIKILEVIEVSEAYKSLKETFSIYKASRILIWIEIVKEEKGKKNDPNYPCIFMKRSW